MTPRACGAPYGDLTCTLPPRHTGEHTSTWRDRYGRVSVTWSTPHLDAAAHRVPWRGAASTPLPR